MYTNNHYYSEYFMAFTILYITVGLALTTIAIEIAADTLKKLHYFGRKIKGVGNIEIWFGSKKYAFYAYFLLELITQFKCEKKKVKGNIQTLFYA